jgi:hypothetical protein
MSDAVASLAGVLAGAGSLPRDVGMIIRILSPSLIAATSSVESLWRVIRTGLDKGAAPRRRK